MTSLFRSLAALSFSVFCAVFLTLSFVPVPAQAQDSADLLEWDPRLVRGTLDNGLSYVIHDSKREGDPFNIRLIVNAGSVDEAAPGGLAHILEHMVFQSTKAHPETIHRYIARLGWRTGVQINAMTRDTETQFMVRTRPHDALDVDGVMALLADMLLAPVLSADDWSRERQVILEELRLNSSVAERVNRLKKAQVRNGSNYAATTPIGTRERIEAVGIDEIQAFHERFYRPSNMTVIVSGRVDPATVVAALDRHFGSYPSLSAPERPYLVLPLRPGIHIGRVQDPAGTSSRVTYAFRVSAPKRDTIDGLRFYLEKYFLGRLIRDRISAQSAAFSGEVEGLTFVLQETTNERLTLAFAAKTHDHDMGLAVLLREVERLRQNGVSETEFAALREKVADIARRNVKAAGSRTYQTWEDKIASSLVQGKVLTHPETERDEILAALDEITFEDLNRRLVEWLGAADRLVYYQVPGSVQRELPTEEHVMSLEAGFARQRFSPVTEGVGVSVPEAKDEDEELEVEEPTARLELPEMSEATGDAGRLSAPEDLGKGVIGWRLENGDRLVWLDRPTPGDKLTIKALSEPGFENRQYPSWLSQAAIQLWDQSGFDFWTETENASYRENKDPKWSVALKPGELDIAAIASPEELSSLLRAYGHKILHVSLSADALSAFRSQMGEDLARDFTPSQKLAMQVNAWRFGNTATRPDARDLEHLTLQDLSEAAANILMQPVTWLVVGRRPQPAAGFGLESLFARHVGRIPRQATLDPVPSRQVDGHRKETVHLYEQAMASVRLLGSTDMEWSPEKAFLLSALTPLTQTALKDELRLRLGGVYSVAFEMTLSPWTDRLELDVSFTCAPDRAEELALAARAVLDDLPNRLTGMQLDRLREDIRFAESGRLEDPNTWVRRLGLSLRSYGDARYLETMAQLADQLTQDRIEALAQSLIPLDRSLTVIALPRKAP